MNKNHWIMIITALWTSCFRRLFGSERYKRLYKSSCWIIHDDEYYVRDEICGGPETAGRGHTDLALEATENMCRPDRLNPLGELGGRLKQQNFREMAGNWNSLLWRLHFTEVRRRVIVVLLWIGYIVKCAIIRGEVDLGKGEGGGVAGQQV
jgi:hypothetical protein